MREEASLEAMMPKDQTSLILKEIQNLTNCARIQREVVPYTALSTQFSSCGGLYSLTNPALFLPFQHLYRKNGHSPFSQERAGENLKEELWLFSDDEVRFFIARELSQIKENSILLKVAIKISILAALFVIYASPFGLGAGLFIFIGAIGLYIYSERILNQRADIFAAEILGKRIANPVKVAISALEKQRLQNLKRLKTSPFAKWYITKSGNNVLDFVHPFLTTRIERLRQCEKSF